MLKMILITVICEKKKDSPLESTEELGTCLKLGKLEKCGKTNVLKCLLRFVQIFILLDKLMAVQ